jgi:hypothetical protein
MAKRTMDIMIRKYTKSDGRDLYFHTGLEPFKEVFDPKTGFYARTGIIKDCIDTGVDPFMRQFPNLLDIGIMG